MTNYIYDKYMTKLQMQKKMKILQIYWYVFVLDILQVFLYFTCYNKLRRFIKYEYNKRFYRIRPVFEVVDMHNLTPEMDGSSTFDVLVIFNFEL